MAVTDGWSPSLLTGHKDIDNEHREIFSAVDALLNALRLSYGEQEVGSTLKSLEQYASKHFQHEEALMLAKNYPEQDAHIEAHRAFTRRLVELRAMMDRSGATKALAVQTLQSIGKLLMNDIETYDRKLARFLTSEGKAS